MTNPATYSFPFQAQELPEKLSQFSQEMLQSRPTGYWLCEFSATDQPCQANSLYIALLRGRVVFSGHQLFSWPGFIHTLQRYVPRLRSQDAKLTLASLEQKLIPGQNNTPPTALLKLLYELQERELVSSQEVNQALRLKILNDFDKCLFHSSGYAQFLPSPQLYTQAPILGFDIDALLADAYHRQSVWRSLERQVPSMERVPMLNTEAVRRANLSVEHKLRLESQVMANKTLDEIASNLAQDPLEIAKGFAKLIDAGLVNLHSPSARMVPEVVIVDDSQLILKQFKNLVTHWGYDVSVCHTPETALQTLLKSNPSVIFLDINMPGISGFDLLKQIRRQPNLTTVPLVMLTAEKTLSNNWRAQWSGCRFLTKPLTPQAVPEFQLELRSLLHELAPLQTPITVENQLVKER